MWAEFILGNMKVPMNFLPFLKTEMLQVEETPSLS